MGIAKKVQMNGVRVSPDIWRRLKELHSKFGRVTSKRGKGKQTFSNFVEMILGEYVYEKHKVRDVLEDGVEWDIEDFE